MARDKIIRLFNIIKKDGFRNGVGVTKAYLVRHIERQFEKLLRLYLKFRGKKGLTLRNIQGNKMYISLVDPGLSSELLLKGVHEKLPTRIFKRELKKGMRVLDIGANLGYYALIEASAVGNEGKVYAIEPIPRNFEILKKNIEINNYGNIVETYCLAISDKKGLSKIILTEQSNWCSMLGDKNLISDQFQGQIYSEKKLNVNTITVDEFLRDKPPVDFIRMDIEGYEVKAIKGMHKTLNQMHPPKLFLELHPAYFKNPSQTIGWMLQGLIDLGFKAKVVIPYESIQFLDVPSTKLPEMMCRYNSSYVFLEKI